MSQARGRKAWRTKGIPYAKNTGKLLLVIASGWLQVHERWDVCGR